MKTEMNTKQLGNSDLCITPIGFGAWAIGGSGWEFGWGEQDDKQSVAAIQRALELGVNWIDTAAVERLRKVGERHGRPPGQIAIAWALRNLAVTGAIVGARNAKQIQGNVGAAELHLSDEEMAKIDGRSIDEPELVTRT